MIVPLFALANAGIYLGGDTLSNALTSPVTLGIVAALVLGKPLGILFASWLGTRKVLGGTRLTVTWPALITGATSAGIGFTVSLLIGELAFEGDVALTDEVKAAVLTGSVIAAVIATVLLKLRNARYRRLYDAEERDEDQDGVPDVYEEDEPEYHLRMAALYERRAAEHRRIASLKEAQRRGTTEVPGGAGEENDRPA